MGAGGWEERGKRWVGWCGVDPWMGGQFRPSTCWLGFFFASRLTVQLRLVIGRALRSVLVDDGGRRRCVNTGFTKCSKEFQLKWFSFLYLCVLVFYGVFKNQVRNFFSNCICLQKKVRVFFENFRRPLENIRNDVNLHKSVPVFFGSFQTSFGNF